MIKDINFDLVGNLIIKLREKYGLNQQEFAKEIHVSKGAVCQWENGSGIKTENLYDIAKYFNITVSELLDGQLLDEEDDDFFQRNYNLDDFEYFSEIDDSNYDVFVEYLKRCKNVIKRFMSLYFLNKENKLGKKQIKEFMKMYRYFEVDYYYASDINLDSFVSSIDSAVEELNTSFDIKSQEELDYILYKLFHPKMKVNPLAVLNYQNNEFIANQYLELMGKEYCDSLLTRIISEIKDDEIENSLAIKRLVEHGARCLFTRKHIQSYEYNEIDKSLLNQFEGLTENKLIKDRYDFFKEKTNTYDLFESVDPYSWKNYNKNQYEYLVDIDTTNRIRDIVLLKDSDPKSYYKNLVEHDAKLLEGK